MELIRACWPRTPLDSGEQGTEMPQSLIPFASAASRCDLVQGEHRDCCESDKKDDIPMAVCNGVYDLNQRHADQNGCCDRGYRVPGPLHLLRWDGVALYK